MVSHQAIKFLAHGRVLTAHPMQLCYREFTDRGGFQSSGRAGVTVASQPIESDQFPGKVKPYDLLISIGQWLINFERS